MNLLSTRVGYTSELVSTNLRSNVELCAYDTKVIDNDFTNINICIQREHVVYNLLPGWTNFIGSLST